MHLRAATIRTQVMLPLRFADGFGTTARSTPSTGSPRAGCNRSRPCPAAAVSADLEVPPLVRIRAECLTGDGLGNDRYDCGPQRRTHAGPPRR
jgi:GTP cyclohydrolase II